VAGLNEALLAKAAAAKLLRTVRMQADTDTTVIPANVAYPTDSGLLARAVGKVVRTAGRVQGAGGAPGTAVTDRRRPAARRVREIADTSGCSRPALAWWVSVYVQVQSFWMAVASNAELIGRRGGLETADKSALRRCNLSVLVRFYRIARVLGWAMVEETRGSAAARRDTNG